MRITQKYPREYACWSRLKRACTNPTDLKYYLYGKAGITWQDEWKYFDQFFNDVGNMPDTCNSMKLLDESNKNFSKFNFMWFQAKPGQRSHKSAIPPRERKKFSDAVTVCLRLNRELHALIKLHAHRKSLETNDTHTVNDLIRDALQKEFPAQSQIDIFGDKK